MEKQFNLELDSNGMVSSRDIHGFLGINKAYTTWIKSWIKNLDVKQGEDFIPCREESSGGRPSHDYLVNKDMAMSLVMVSKAPLSNQLRKHLISLFDKRQNLELITPEEAVFANKVLECLVYVENQKKAYNLHMDNYINKATPYGNIYAQFHSYRNSIIGWDKEKIENAVKEFILKDQHPIKSKGLTDRLNIIDAPEAIRVACLDLLLSNDQNINDANKFANLIKKMASIKNVQPMPKNETNLFESKKVEAQISIVQNEIKALN